MFTGKALAFQQDDSKSTTSEERRGCAASGTSAYNDNVSLFHFAEQG